MIHIRLQCDYFPSFQTSRLFLFLSFSLSLLHANLILLWTIFSAFAEDSKFRSLCYFTFYDFLTLNKILLEHFCVYKATKLLAGCQKSFLLWSHWYTASNEIIMSRNVSKARGIIQFNSCTDAPWKIWTPRASTGWDFLHAGRWWRRPG